MENPRRFLAITLAFTGACAAGAWVLHATRSPDAGSGGRDAAVVFLTCFAGYGVLSVPFLLRSVRKLNRIQRGVGARARWTVPRDEWARFVANERERATHAGVLSNLVDLGMRVPASGVEIVITDEAVVIGDELHRLNGIRVQSCSGPRAIESTPATLEYEVGMIDPDDTQVQRAIRFPVAPTADRQAWVS